MSEERPLCPRCREPVSWLPRAEKWSSYCGGSQGCVNPQRVCKGCGRTYARNGGGTMYCSPTCLRARYHAPSKGRPCPRCGSRANVKPGNAWGLCPACFRRIASVANALRSHGVPLAMVLRLIDDPTCDNPACDVDVLRPRVNPETGIARSDLAVDHDHGHCSGKVGCEECVRGLLCLRCNSALGMTFDDADRMRGLADYIESRSHDCQEETA